MREEWPSSNPDLAPVGLHPNFFLFPQFSALIFYFVFFVSHLKSAFHSSLWYKYSESMVIIPTVGRLLFTPLC